jgi:hypothetical protein
VSPQSPWPDYGYPVQAGHPGQAGYLGAGYGHPVPPNPRRSRTGLVIGIVASVLVVGGAVGAFAFAHGGNPTANPTVPAGRNISPSPAVVATPGPATSEPVPSVTGIAPEPDHHFTVPVFDGWDSDLAGRPNVSLYFHTGRYTCADGRSCVRGRFSIEKDTVQGATAQAAATAAMPDYAKRLYPGLDEHTDYGSDSLTVAGAAGYAVRWHIHDADGTRGWLVLTAVPAKDGGFVLIEGSVDDDPAAPDRSVLEQILSGIKPVS